MFCTLTFTFTPVITLCCSLETDVLMIGLAELSPRLALVIEILLPVYGADATVDIVLASAA